MHAKIQWDTTAANAASKGKHQLSTEVCTSRNITTTFAMFSQLRRSVTVTVYILLLDIKKPTQLHKVKVVDFLFVQDWRRGENKDACAV